MLIADSTTLSGNARLALFVLIGVLLVILGFLIAFAVLIRRHRRDDIMDDDFDVPTRAPLSEVQEELVMMAASVASSARGGGGLEVASSASAVTCPTCRREYDTPLEFCPHDARRLIPTSLLAAGDAARVCPACKRTFDGDEKYCPHDASELMPVGLESSPRERRHGGHSGVVAKMCPQCNHRYDLSETHCATDGAELVTLN